MDTTRQNPLFYKLVKTWEAGYKVTMPTKPALYQRLKELQTWDVANDAMERAAKIQALKNLIQKLEKAGK